MDPCSDNHLEIFHLQAKIPFLLGNILPIFFISVLFLLFFFSWVLLKECLNCSRLKDKSSILVKNITSTPEILIIQDIIRMEPSGKVKLTKCTCRRCKRTFKTYSYWYEHMNQEHGSVFLQKSSGNISSSRENTISLVQYLKTTTEEQTFVASKSSSSLHADKEESLPIIENQTDVSTLPQIEASGATTSQDLDVCEQTSRQQAENKPASGLFSWNKESLSREVKTLTANSDPKIELSTSSQEAGEKTAAELISLNQEKLLQEMETSIDSKVVDRLFYGFCILDRLKGSESSSITSRKGEKPVFDRQNCTLNSLWYHKSDEKAADIELPPFKEKDGGRFTLEPPPEPVDLSAKLRAITAIRNSRLSEKPRLKELLGSLSLPVINSSTGTTPYEHQELPPCESPLEIAERILARGLHSNKVDKKKSINEDMDETGEGNNTSDKGISLSGEETDETDEAISDLINYTSTPYQQSEDNTAALNSSNQTSGTSPQETDTNFSSGLGAKTLTASSSIKNEQSTPCQQAEDNTAAQTSSSQTSGISPRVSDTNFSSGQGAKTLTAGSDPKNEPSMPCQQAEDNTAAQTSSNQTSETSLESYTHFSSDHTAKTLSAISDPKNEQSTLSEEAEGKTAEQTSSNQTSEISLEYTNFSSGEGDMTHNPDVHAETTSDPTNEPSTSYQHAENKTETKLFSLYKESLSREVETLTARNDPKNVPSTPCEEAGDNNAAQTSSNQTSETSLESDTHFSSDHTAKTLTGSSDPKNEPSTTCQQTENNPAAQTSSNQTSETSLESDTNFSSGQGANGLTGSSDPKNEPSTSCKEAEDNTAARTSSSQTTGISPRESDTNFSSSQGAKALTASSDPENEPSTPSGEAEGNTAAQTSSSQMSGISLESDTNFSSGEGAMTHNPDVHAEASSYPTYEPCQEAGDYTAAELISLNQETLLQEMETLVDRLFDRFCAVDGLEGMSANEDRTWKRWIREIIFQLKEFLFQAGQILTLASWTDRELL